MNLRNDRRQNIQGELDFSTEPRGEARQAGREESESFPAVQGPVRTVVWQGSVGDRCPYADQQLVEPERVQRALHSQDLDAWFVVAAPGQLCVRSRAWQTKRERFVDGFPLSLGLW